MIKKIFLLPLLLGTLLFTGCIESGTMLVVNTDGSGTIIARAFMNTQVMEGFGGLGGLGEGAGAPAPDMTASLKASLEGAAEIFGEVKFESIKEVKNKLGWKGYEATYSFTDANKVRMASPDVEMDGGGGGPEMEGGDTIYDIKFSPGNPATIEFIAEIPEEEDDGADEAGGEEEAFQPQMMAMMAPMLKGMRVSYLVKVNGKITESNGKYLNKESGTLLLMDMQVDKLLANPDAAKLMGGKKPDFKELSKKEIPGLKFHNPEENVKISFK